MKERGKLKRVLTHEPISFIQQAERRRIERLRNIKGTVKSGMKLSSDYIRKKVESRHQEFQKNRGKTNSNKHEVKEFQFDKVSLPNGEKTKYGLKLTPIPDVETQRSRIVNISTNDGKENINQMHMRRCNSEKRIDNSMISNKTLKSNSTVVHDRVFIPAGKNTRVTEVKAKEKKEKLQKISPSQIKNNISRTSKKEIKNIDAKFQRGTNLDCLEKEKQEALAILNEIDKGFGHISCEDRQDIPEFNLIKIGTKEVTESSSPSNSSFDSTREDNNFLCSNFDSLSEGITKKDQIQPITFKLESFFPSKMSE